MTSHQKRRQGMLVSYHKTMSILQAGQTKNVTKTQDSTNANLSKYSNVLGCKQLQIRMMGMFVCLMVQSFLMVGHVATSLTPEEMFVYFMTRMKKGLPHTDMCNIICGGSSKRWSPGWR
jgi:hypothetical protein